jgi:hypothetical protein
MDAGGLRPTMRGMLLRLAILVASAFLAAPAVAGAAGGSYDFAGGTPRQQAQVRSALEASSFDWGIVPEKVTVHIGAYGVSHSTRGHVFLDGGLLDSGRFAWPTVMDEYAHQIDFFLLDPARRAVLQSRLGASAWCYETGGLGHAAYGCERFSSMVAWAFWPVKESSYRPTSRTDETAAMAAAEFRSLLADLIGTQRTIASVKRR